jgi:2-methylisocitrate lyase-like PEP mutase family enzyme
MSSTQAEKAESFRRMHHGPEMLVLPNAWDVASARIFESAGFPAVATTSAGVAWSLGYPDGHAIGRERMLEAVARITAHLSVPVTADMCAGFGPRPEDAAETVRGIVHAGAVGLNLEDGTDDPHNRLVEMSLHVEKIQAARAAANALGVPVVINARTDVFLASAGDPSTRLEHAARRANAYKDAGADSLFVPGVYDAPTIAELVKTIHGPVNILARAGIPPLAQLAKLGVARVSVGSGAMLASLAHLRLVATELRAGGALTTMFTGAIPYAEMNEFVRQSAGGRS